MSIKIINHAKNNFEINPEIIKARNTGFIVAVTLTMVSIFLINISNNDIDFYSRLVCSLVASIFIPFCLGVILHIRILLKVKFNKYIAKSCFYVFGVYQAILMFPILIFILMYLRDIVHMYEN